MPLFIELLLLLISILVFGVGMLGARETAEHDYYTWKPKFYLWLAFGGLVVSSVIIGHLLH